MNTKIITLLSIFIIIVSCNNTARKAPLAINGILDLRNWNFNNNGPACLDGEWEFYRNKILGPEDFQQDQTPIMSGYLHIPSAWKKQNSKNGDGINQLGYGTYRLKILTKEIDTDVIFYTSNIFNPYKIYADGQLILRKGISKILNNKSVSNKTIFENNYTIKNPSIEIIVQFANNRLYDGINNHIYLNKLNNYFNSLFWDKFLHGIMLGIMIFIFLYHFIFFLIRRKNYATLFFSLYCLLMIIRFAFHNNFIRLPFQSIIFQFFLLRLELLTFYTGIPIFFLFIYTLYPEEHHLIVLKLKIFFGTIITILSFTAPVSFLRENWKIMD